METYQKHSLKSFPGREGGREGGEGGCPIEHAECPKLLNWPGLGL